MRLFATFICLLVFSLPVFTQRLVYDASFTPTINGVLEHMEMLPDGKMLIVGDFITVNNTARKEIARLNADGSLDTSFNADWLGGSFGQNIEITAVKVLPDGKILVAGDMPFDGSSGPDRVRRLNADGSPDGTLTAIPRVDEQDGGFDVINSVDQLPNGKILVCGDFDLANNNPKAWLARYNNDGTYDATFTTTFNSNCNDVEALSDGKYLVAGTHTTVNGNSSPGLLRFNADDSIDTGFVLPTIPNSGAVRSNFLKRLSDGSLIVSMLSNAGNKIARLNADGSLRQFLSGNGAELLDAVIQPNGKTLLSIEESFRRVNTDGTDDPSLGNIDFYGSGLNNVPYEPRGMAITADGKLIAAGTFTGFDNPSGTGMISRQYLARFELQAIPYKHRYDFDGDGKDDIAVWRPSDRVWYINSSTNGFSSTQFGISTDIPVVADYDGDGKTDIAVWRADGGVWYWLKSTDFTLGYAIVGQPGDIPQQRNPNGRASQIIYRPSTAKWWSFNGFNPPSTFSMGVEQVGDIPVRGDDFDGDGFSELAVYRSGTWIYRKSSGNQIINFQWGLAGDKPVAGDYDGDGRSDFAVFRPSDGVWYIYKSNEGFYAVQWGISGDLPVAGDYDGDGKTDIAVYRPSNGTWYIIKSTGSYHIEKFGISEDIPAQLR